MNSEARQAPKLQNSVRVIGTVLRKTKCILISTFLRTPGVLRLLTCYKLDKRGKLEFAVVRGVKHLKGHVRHPCCSTCSAERCKDDPEIRLATMTHTQTICPQSTSSMSACQACVSPGDTFGAHTMLIHNLQ